MNFYNFATDSRRECDRLLIMGRRGTGKSTGVKRWLSEGKTAVYVVATQKAAASFAHRFVNPAVAHLLPKVEDGEEGCKFGAGAFAVISWSDIPNIRDTGLSVAGKIPDIIVHDEAIRVDGRYKHGAPELLDDLAGTLGRTGRPPKIVVIGNPINNTNPFSTHWRLNCLVEGEYQYNGKKSVVVGTADCVDCFGKPIGVDAASGNIYTKHLCTGGTVVVVESRGLRVRQIGGCLYAGVAEPQGTVFVKNGRYTSAFYRPGGTEFVYNCRQAYYEGRVVFDSFTAELDFYLLANVK